MRYILAFLSLFIFWSCENEELPEANTSAWTITWMTDQHFASGTAFFLPDNKVKIIVENPDDYLLTQKEEVMFDLQLEKDEFTLIRKDNQFKMTYAILDQSKNRYLLKYEDDVIVKITR